jgi:hypothetical protein
VTFGTFVLYFIGAAIVLVVGWKLFQWLIIGVAVGTMGASDGAKKWANRRASRKWEKAERELEDSK